MNLKAAEFLNTDGSCISAVCKGRRKTHKGFRWEYSNEEDKKYNIIHKEEHPEGYVLPSFSKYIIINDKDVIKIYSLFRSSFISIRNKKKWL